MGRGGADGHVVEGAGAVDEPALTGGSDPVLLSDDLLRIGGTFRLARRRMRIARQDLSWAFLCNVLGIALAMAGILNPILAAGAMVLSSLSVIGNSLRLARIQPLRGRMGDEEAHRVP